MTLYKRTVRSQDPGQTLTSRAPAKQQQENLRVSKIDRMIEMIYECNGHTHVIRVYDKEYTKIMNKKIQMSKDEGRLVSTADVVESMIEE